jgi:hypothetical protein
MGTGIKVFRVGDGGWGSRWWMLGLSLQALTAATPPHRFLQLDGTVTKAVLTIACAVSAREDRSGSHPGRDTRSAIHLRASTRLNPAWRRSHRPQSQLLSLGLGAAAQSKIKATANSPLAETEPSQSKKEKKSTTHNTHPPSKRNPAVSSLLSLSLARPSLKDGTHSHLAAHDSLSLPPTKLKIPAQRETRPSTTAALSPRPRPH